MRENIARSGDAPGSLLYLRFKIFKQWIIEKFTNADFQAITNLLDRNNSRILAFFIFKIFTPVT